MKKYISISGLAASGKSTIGEKIAKSLKWEFISVGNYSRQIAKKEFGMDINKFQKYCEQHPEIDEKIDNLFVNMILKKDKLIIDYRLSFHFIPDAFNVFLKVSEKEAVRRLINANRTDEFKQQNSNFIKSKMNERNFRMQQRFLKQYNVDFLNPKNYNIIINTEKYDNLNEIVDIIIDNFKLI